MKRIIILGTGGNCIDILDSIQDINEAAFQPVYACQGFLDDNPATWGLTLHGVKVLGPLPSAAQYADCSFVFGIGSVRNYHRREDILRTAGVPDERFETIIHPSASVSRSAKLGSGSVILQHVTVASDATVGRHVYILPNSIISHGALVDDFATIAGGVCISGNVRVGFSCYIGTNAALRDGVSIGERALVGMSSVVLSDVPARTVVAGNPAKVLRQAEWAE